MKKSKFGLLNFDSVETLSREELKKVKGGYTNCYNCDIYPTPPPQTVECDCLVQVQNGWIVYNQLYQWTSSTGSCYNPRPSACSN